MNYSIFNPTTGQIVSHVTATNNELAKVNLQGCSYVEGVWPSDQYYVENDQVLSLPERPTNSNHVYEFDWTTKTWNIDVVQTINIKRQQRNNLLSAIDCVNPVWYASLTLEQQQALQAYRQALLDVPQQAGFPTHIDWPIKPQWL